jgi:hypothetical protein
MDQGFPKGAVRGVRQCPRVKYSPWLGFTATAFGSTRFAQPRRSKDAACPRVAQLPRSYHLSAGVGVVAVAERRAAVIEKSQRGVQSTLRRVEQRKDACCKLTRESTRQ